MAETHFGFETVDESEKVKRVAGVFDSVAPNYDIMNDLMSMGLHRIWKKVAIDLAQVRPGHRCLDLASGSGDLALALAKRVGPSGQCLMSDINFKMLHPGRDRALDAGLTIPALVADAEALPLPSNVFDCVTVAFGLRNMTHPDVALREMTRVLKPGGRLIVLEFSKVWGPLQPLYDAYSFGVLPKLGQWVAGDSASYRYLAESIRKHPDQDTLAGMMREIGLAKVDYHNLTAGVVAVHRGFKS